MSHKKKLNENQVEVQKINLQKKKLINRDFVIISDLRASCVL
jgi:hypothetical protein